MKNNQIDNKHKFISKEIIQELKSSISIIDVVSHYVKLKKKGANYLGICPFHDDKHESLSVNPRKEIFKCFACNTSGDMIKFVQLVENVKFNDAVKIIAKIANFDLPKIQNLPENKIPEKQKRIILANERLGKFYHDQLLLLKANVHALNYLKSRGLDEATIKKFKIGYAVNDKNRTIDFLTNRNNALLNLTPEQQFNEQELLDAGIATVNSKGKISPLLIDRITFPIYDANNNLVAFSGRDLSGQSEAKYLHTKATEVFGKSKILYNFNNVVKSTNLDHLIICEGFMDCIAYNRAGYANCVATMGTALTPDHIKMIKRLKGIKSVILSFDNDNAGIQANINNAKALLDAGIDVNIVNYSGMKEKDIDEIQLKYGSEAVKNLIDKREDFCMFLIKTQKNTEKSPDILKYEADEMLRTIQDYGNPYLIDKYINEYADRTTINEENLKCRNLAINEIDKIRSYFRSGEYALKVKIKKLEQKIEILTEEIKQLKKEPLSFKKDKD